MEKKKEYSSSTAVDGTELQFCPSVGGLSQREGSFGLLVPSHSLHGSKSFACSAGGEMCEYLCGWGLSGGERVSLRQTLTVVGVHTWPSFFLTFIGRFLSITGFV